MITLAIDTCEPRGGVAIRRDGWLISARKHENDEDYSNWLLPAVEQALRDAEVSRREVNLIAVATGPGSFTGLRVGLTTVKAWAEVHGTPLVGVSRLEAMVRAIEVRTHYAASWYDAQRGQLFGGLYRLEKPGVFVERNEMVIAPEGFLAFVEQQTGGESVTWVSLDPDLLTSLNEWRERRGRGESVRLFDALLADAIGALGEERARLKQFTEVLQLDANYVRRSDAEIFWKDSSPVPNRNEPRAAAGLLIREFGSNAQDAETASKILREASGASPWSAGMLAGSILPGTCAYLSERSGEATGFIAGRRVAADEGEVLNLAVREAFRRQGEGRALIDRLLTDFQRKGIRRVFLEVRESNLGARMFYERLGFQCVARRDGYYRNPVEAAVVMALSVKLPQTSTN